jgi:predicted metal-dependent phosphotriesterase family hydrolase
MNGEPIVRTVLGDIRPVDLGVLDYHEHLFQASPLLKGEELADESLSAQEATLLHTHGVGAMVEATPIGLGRNVEAVARISAATGLTVVHTTGAHHSAHYSEHDPLLTLPVDELAERFIAEIVEGFLTENQLPALGPHGSPVRAGLVKAGVRYWAMNPFEKRVLEACGRAALQTGCAVMVHLDYGSAAHEVLDIFESHGLQPRRIVLAHMDRNLDPGLHADLASRGAYLGYDGMARHRDAPDSAILDCLSAAVDLGAGSRIVLGGDVARASRYTSYGGMPGLAYLPQRFLPRLAERVSREIYRAVTRDNGAQLLSMPARSPRLSTENVSTANSE